MIPESEIKWSNECQALKDLFNAIPVGRRPNLMWAMCVIEGLLVLQHNTLETIGRHLSGLDLSAAEMQEQLLPKINNLLS